MGKAEVVIVSATTAGKELERGRDLQRTIDLSHLTGKGKASAREWIQSYHDVFALDPDEIGLSTAIEHRIDTPGARPVKLPCRRLPFAYLKEVDEQLDWMLEKGIIRESVSPWSAPMVIARKKSGAVRICVDFRRLNELTVKDSFPLPRIDNTLDMLSGCRYFTTIDLLSGYICKSRWLRAMLAKPRSSHIEGCTNSHDCHSA